MFELRGVRLGERDQQAPGSPRIVEQVFDFAIPPGKKMAIRTSASGRASTRA
jgi:hypothetical protein